VEQGYAIEVPSTGRMALSVNEAANALGMSASTVWKLIALDHIRVVRLGRRTVITIQELQRLLTEGTQ